MKWVPITTDMLLDQATSQLSDSAWRLLIEIDLLCGINSGPIESDATSIAWLLRRDEAAVAKALRTLLQENYLELHENDTLCPVKWLERNAAYLKKLDYNRDRYQSTKTRGDNMETLDYDDKKKQTLDPEAEKLWDSLPGNGGRGKSSKTASDVFKAMLQSDADRHQWQVWASERIQLRRAPEDIQRISWMLHDLAGMMPFGTANSWATHIFALLEAANNDATLVEKAIKEAVRNRDERGITLSGPRSIVGYVRNESSKQQTASKSRKQGVSTGADREMLLIEI